MNKLAKFAHKPAMKKVFGIFFAALMIVSMALPSFATEGETSLDSSWMVDEAEAAMTSVFSNVVSVLSVETIIKFVGVAVAAAVGLFIFWWGTRKVVKIVRKAFASGKVSF